MDSFPVMEGVWERWYMKDSGYPDENNPDVYHANMDKRSARQANSMKRLSK